MFSSHFPRYRHKHNDDIAMFKWNKLSDCILTRESGSFIISEEVVSRTGDRNWREFMSLTFPSIVRLFDGKSYDKCHYHEIVPHNNPVYLFMEFDVKRTDEWTDHTVNSLRRGVNMIKDAMSAYAGRKLSWVTLSATDIDEKFSQHIISQSISFQNRTQCCQFIVNSLINMIEKYEKDRLDDKVYRKAVRFTEKIVTLITGTFCGFPDFAVYSNNHPLRTCYSSKNRSHSSSLRTLLPMKNGIRSIEFSPDILKKSLMTCFDTWELFHIDYHDNPMSYFYKWMLDHKYRSSPQNTGNSSSRSTRTFLPKTIFKTKKFNTRATDVLSEFMKTYFNRWDHKVALISYSDYFITFYLVGRYCFVRRNNGGKHTSSGGRTLTLTLSSGIIKIRCIYNQNCKGRCVEARLSDEHRMLIKNLLEKIIERRTGCKRVRKGNITDSDTKNGEDEDDCRVTKKMKRD